MHEVAVDVNQRLAVVALRNDVAVPDLVEHVAWFIHDGIL
jgi:hypothetical protein